MAQESKKAVVAAIIGNLAIAVIKFIAAAITGSSAMISEGIHSVVDTGNGGLLYYGLSRGARPADENHPFGHGKEVYFWSLIVAISIFAIGGGMSIYEGITHIQHPAPLENPTINYVVLGSRGRLREHLVQRRLARVPRVAARRGRTLIAAIHHGKDPSLFTVLFEDTAALIGLAVAFVGVFLSHQLDAPCSTARPRSSSAASSWSRRSGSPTRAGVCWWARRRTRRWSPTSAASSWTTRR